MFFSQQGILSTGFKNPFVFTNAVCPGCHTSFSLLCYAMEFLSGVRVCAVNFLETCDPHMCILSLVLCCYTLSKFAVLFAWDFLVSTVFVNSCQTFPFNTQENSRFLGCKLLVLSLTKVIKSKEHWSINCERLLLKQSHHR